MMNIVSLVHGLPLASKTNDTNRSSKVVFREFGSEILCFYAAYLRAMTIVFFAGF